MICLTFCLSLVIFKHVPLPSVKLSVPFWNSSTGYSVSVLLWVSFILVPFFELELSNARIPCEDSVVVKYRNTDFYLKCRIIFYLWLISLPISVYLQNLSNVTRVPFGKWLQYLLNVTFNFPYKKCSWHIFSFLKQKVYVIFLRIRSESVDDVCWCTS